MTRFPTSSGCPVVIDNETKIKGHLDEISKTLEKIKDCLDKAEEKKFKVVGRVMTMGLASGHGKTHIFSDMYSVPGDYKDINEKYDWDGSERGVSL